MSAEAESLPPIRFSFGGRFWQLCIAIVSAIATYALIFIDKLPFKEAIILFLPLSVYMSYLYWKKASVLIWDDRVEFAEFRAKPEMIKFSDITRLELEKSYSARTPDRTYVTMKALGKENRVLLPYVYKDTFGPLKKQLQKWHNDPLEVLHSLSDGGQDRDVWNAPKLSAT